jgi:hypothetical protein
MYHLSFPWQEINENRIDLWLTPDFNLRSQDIAGMK